MISGLTFNAEFKADVAERHGPCLRLQLADTADVVIVQIDVHKLLLFVHRASGGSKREHMAKHQLQPPSPAF